MTIAELYIHCWTNHWNKPRYQRSRWAKVVEGYYRLNIGPAFGDMDIKDLSPKMIRTWLKTYEEKPYSGNRSLGVLSRMFTLAEEEEFIPVGSNPCSAVSQLPEYKRDRYATEEELKRVIEILAKKSQHLKSRPGAAFLMCLLLTGSRPIAIKRAKRSDIRYFDHNGETWGMITFMGKSSISTGQKEKVLLPPRILELMNQIREPKDGSLFGTTRSRTLWKNVIKEAGCPDLWSRDLRRTFATIGMSAGVGMDVVGELLNHNSTQTTKIYAKLMDSARVNAVQTITDQIRKLSKPQAS
jgi:integrase